MQLLPQNLGLNSVQDLGACIQNCSPAALTSLSFRYIHFCVTIKVLAAFVFGFFSGHTQSVPGEGSPVPLGRFICSS